MKQRDRQPFLAGLVPPLWSEDVAKELSEHRGRWVAVADDRLVAVADTLPEVRASALEQGIDDPLVFRAPSHPEQVAAYLVQPSGF